MSLWSRFRRWFGLGGSNSDVALAPVQAATPTPLRTPRTVLVGGSPNTSSYLEPQPRSVISWTPTDIRLALQRADTGDLRRVADLCDSILGDDRAPAVFATRRAALFGSRLLFDPAKGRRKGMAIRALEAEEDWWTIFPEEEFGQLLTWGWLLGAGIGELVLPPAVVAEERAVPRLKVWHPRNLRFDYQTRRWLLRVMEGQGETEIAITPGDGKWVLFTPYGASRPWAFGLWRGMARMWLLKQYAIDDWGRHSEVHGVPTRVAVPREGVSVVTSDVRREIAADIADLGRDSSICLPAGLDLKLIEATANTWAMFNAQIALANTAMSVMAIGSNIPTEVAQGGGDTGGTAQHLVRQDYKRTDSETVSTFARGHVLVWWALWNFGDSHVAPWPRWDFEPPIDLQALSTTLKQVADSLQVFATAEVPVNGLALCERFNVPVLPGWDGKLRAPPKPKPDAFAPKPNAAPEATDAETIDE